MSNSNEFTYRCVAVCRSGEYCTRPATEFRHVGGPVFLCRQHASLHRQIEAQRGQRAADERIGWGVAS